MRLSATYILIGINILIFAAETMAGGTENREIALKFGAQYTPYVKKGQWYRMFTSMFLHFGFIHLICNMYSLYNLGPALEQFFGIPLFLLLYLNSEYPSFPFLLPHSRLRSMGVYLLSDCTTGADP
jgi:rhomboid protease GluP